MKNKACVILSQNISAHSKAEGKCPAFSQNVTECPSWRLFVFFAWQKCWATSLLKAYRQGFYGAGDAKRGKNSFYLFRSNPKINWREVMARVALRLKSFIIKNNMAETKAPHCFIIDDTAIAKTGLKMERASKIHDHTDGRYKLGYKLLACAYFDG